MKLRKLLALALAGVTVLSVTPVQAKTTNSIGYTNFLFPEDGNNYFINAEHKFLGNRDLYKYDSDKNKHVASVTDIVNQEVKLPKNTYVSFDITSLVHDWYLQDKRLKGVELRDFTAVQDLVEKHKWDEFNDANFSPSFDKHSKNLIQPSKTATVTFTQNGKQLAKFTLNREVLADNRNFSFYNKSTSPVEVTVDTDSWFAIDLGYTAHKANKKDITDNNWTFSTLENKTYIAKVTKPKIDGITGDYSGFINYISIDGKPATIKIYQKNKLVQTKTIKSCIPFSTKRLKAGKYTIKVSTKSNGYSILATDRYYCYKINKGKKSSIKLTKDFFDLFGTAYAVKKKTMLINVVPTKGTLGYGNGYNWSSLKTSTPLYFIDEMKDGDRTGARENSNGYSVAVQGEELGNLKFDRLSW